MKSPFAVSVGPKGQITIAARIRRALGVKPGTRFSIYPIGKDCFVAEPRRPSRILDFAGDLKELDAKLRKQKEATRR